MKKIIPTAMLVLTLGAFPAISLAGDKSMSPAEREQKLEKMAKDLKLTQEQKNQIRSIKDDKYQKIEEAKKEAREKIRAVLNADQQTKFDKMIADK